MGDKQLMEFANKVMDISSELMKDYADEICTIKLTISQIAILDILSRTKESNMSDLARSMKVTTAAMTGIIDRLVRDGYVARSHDPDDRRVVKARLTQKGANAVRSMHEQRKRMISKMFGVLSQGERDEYLSILTRVRDSIKA